MSRFTLAKLIPSADAIKSSKSLRFLGDLIHDPNLFHLNRRSVSRALFWGLLIGLLPPIPIHTPAAALAALFGHCNLPLILAVVWISNPLTIPVIAYEAYQLGCLILQVAPVSTFELSWDMFYHIWKPYLVGSVTGSLAIATLAYVACDYLWRLKVIRKWNTRRKARAECHRR